MAKYIRTKDYVYDTENLIYRRIEGNKLYQVGWDVEKPTFEADIISQSDNLVDLCDEFRYEFDNFLKHEKCWQDKKTGMWYDSDSDTALNEEEIKTIKGGIWTDKGLIYVVKTNNEGELKRYE